MSNFKLIIEYDGSGFEGFQRVPGARTVQGTIEEALSFLEGIPVKVAGAGRTDAGVHARGQVVSVKLIRGIPPDNLVYAVNRILPADVKVCCAESVPDSFHARRSAVSRSYQYCILNTGTPAALESRYVWQVVGSLNVGLMMKSAEKFIGRHDFKVFGTAPKGKSTLRDLYSLSVMRSGNRVLVNMSANAFLRRMARGIVGALTDVGLGRRCPEEIDLALLNGYMNPPFTIAPPNGLCLIKVDY